LASNVKAQLINKCDKLPGEINDIPIIETERSTPLIPKPDVQQY
jgi:hypothetical protein